MGNIKVDFTVRTRAADEIELVIGELSTVFECQFCREERDDEVISYLSDTTPVFLQLRIVQWRATDDIEAWIYQFSGETTFDPRWEYQKVVNLNDYIIQELSKRSKRAWYVPDRDEWAAEAGIRDTKT